jgi:hypothetical protein
MCVYRCCIQWKVFEVDRTNIFDRIITAIGERVESPKDTSSDAPANGTLCYWLTNTVTLLLLLQKNLKPAATQGSRRLSGASTGGITANGVLSFFFLFSFFVSAHSCDRHARVLPGLWWHSVVATGKCPSPLRVQYVQKNILP